jgi:DNA-binding MarR family transcriptional regulator
MKIADMYKQPGHLIRRAHQFSTAVFMEEAKSISLTPVQFSALTVICDRPGVDAKRVSDLIFFDPSTIGNVLDRLEKRGLIVRKRGLKDRRTKRLFLTPAGDAAIQKIVRRIPEVSRRILGPLSAQERRQFLSFLSRLVSAPEFAGKDKKKASTALFAGAGQSNGRAG